MCIRDSPGGGPPRRGGIRDRAHPRPGDDGMTTDMLTKAMRGTRTASAGTTRRIVALARAEALLLRRNPMALFNAFVVPAALVVLFVRSGLPPDSAERLSGATIVTSLTAFTLLSVVSVVYLNFVTAMVARREVLGAQAAAHRRKQRRRDPRRDRGTRSGDRLGADPDRTVRRGHRLRPADAHEPRPRRRRDHAGDGSVRTAGRRQHGADPHRGDGAGDHHARAARVAAPQWADVPLDGIPEPLARLAHAPLTPVADLLHLGLTGTTPGGATVGLAASFRPGAVAALVLAAWVVARVGATRRRFRWEPR